MLLYLLKWAVFFSKFPVTILYMFNQKTIYNEIKKLVCSLFLPVCFLKH